MEPPPAIGEGTDHGTATALGFLIFNAQQGPPQGFRWKAPANRTGDVAQRLNLSAGRVSQLRRELAESWRQFVGDEPAPEAA